MTNQIYASEPCRIRQFDRSSHGPVPCVAGSSPGNGITTGRTNVDSHSIPDRRVFVAPRIRAPAQAARSRHLESVGQPRSIYSLAKEFAAKRYLWSRKYRASADEGFVRYCDFYGVSTSWRRRVRYFCSDTS